MADLLIKGMEMPKSCGDCPFLYDHDACYVSGMWNDMRFMLLCFNGHTDEYRRGEFPFKEKRVDWCPLVEVPTHGRLIDADATLEAMNTWDKFGFSHTGAFVREPKTDDFVPYVHYEDMVRCIQNMPTVLEASEEE